MKSIFAVGLLAFAVSEVSAFPAIAAEHAARLLKDRDSPVFAQREKRVVFNERAQFVSTSGEHAFVPPNFAAGDQRGPCPGLNALANHGYLPHNGVGTIDQFIASTNKVFGMALDLGGFLAVYGAVFDGNLLAWSIGGPTSRNQLPLSNLLGLTGQPQGISGSHNKYETDTSPTRGDLYLVGNTYKLQVDQFQQYNDALVEGVGAQEQYDNLLNFRVARHEHSVQNNPNFFYAPFSGVLVSPAGFSFPVRMMANHSTAFPEGSLTRKDLATFFAVEGSSGSFTYKEGHERIPDNWYKRAIGNEFTILDFVLDVVNHGTKAPVLLSIGGNTGTVNSFTPVDLSDLTGGVFNSANLLQGNNLACFLLQASMTSVPDVVQGGLLSSVLSTAKQAIERVVGAQVSALGCPRLRTINKNQFKSYPGYTKCTDGCSRY